MKLDQTLNDRQSMRFQTIYNRMQNQFTRSVPFSESEVSNILMVYFKFVLCNGKGARHMTRHQFINVISIFQELHDIDTMERIAHVISESDREITPADFIHYMNILMTNDMETKIRFAYDVYDINGNGITRERICHAVTKYFQGDEEDEINELRTDMVEFLFAKFDEDRDNLINFEEYRKIVLQRPSMLEFLGPVFASHRQRGVIAYCMGITSVIPDY